MIPVGYMAKRICSRPEWLKTSNVIDLYSVSSCVSEDFFDDFNEPLQYNGYWFFDSPEIIQALAQERSIDLQGTKLFYYEALEMELDENGWQSFRPEPSLPTNIVRPLQKSIEGFDVVTFSAGRSAECSPLSCTSISENIRTNSHCLFDSFEEAKTSLNAGEFADSEPGPYRIFAVYSVDWP